MHDMHNIFTMVFLASVVVTYAQPTIAPIKAIGDSEAMRLEPLMLASAVDVMTSASVPEPLAFWTFQEPTGTPRVSTRGLYSYTLHDGNATDPIQRVDGGLFGPYSAQFKGRTDANNSRRLFAAREDVPALASELAGPHATVTLAAWVRVQSHAEGMIAGVWNENLRARQYALFTHLGACSTAPVYQGGLAAHISNVGGPTPGNRYCITRACDRRLLSPHAWHCLVGVYNGSFISAYVNGTFVPNNNASREDNPFALSGGIFSPEAAGQPGAEFGVGANEINMTVGSPPVWSNQFAGQIAGLAVWNAALHATQVAQVCALAPGFEA